MLSSLSKNVDALKDATSTCLEDILYYCVLLKEKCLKHLSKTVIVLRVSLSLHRRKESVYKRHQWWNSSVLFGKSLKIRQGNSTLCAIQVASIGGALVS